jgi:hypothetical protein
LLFVVVIFTAPEETRILNSLLSRVSFPVTAVIFPFLAPLNSASGIKVIVWSSIIVVIFSIVDS